MLRGVTGKSGNGQPLDSETRADITRTIASAVAAGQLSAGDRTYLAQVVAQRTGIAQPEAEKRVDDAFASALKAIDTARKAAVATGLGTVTALLFGMAAAWYTLSGEDAIAMKACQPGSDSVIPRLGSAGCPDGYKLIAST